MAIIFKNAPKTEEGKKLNLSKEDEEKYIIVYRINQESQQLEIVEPWDTEKEYDNMCVLMPLTSSYEDVVLLSSGTYVRNVVGSSGDTNPYGNCSWLGIIKLVYDVKGISEDADTCCLNGYAYNTTGTPPTIALTVGNHKEGKTLGGHMVVGKDTNNKIKGGPFYLLHICPSHNNTAYDEYCFMVENGTNAIKMKDYMKMQPALLSAMFSLGNSSDGMDVELDLQKFCKENNIELSGALG